MIAVALAVRLTVGLEVALLPVLQVVPDLDIPIVRFIVYLILGGVFGLINTFLRPLEFSLNP